jgi:hypothetical protein
MKTLNSLLLSALFSVSKLQKAIEIALDELKKNPPEDTNRPPCPVKAKN